MSRKDNIKKYEENITDQCSDCSQNLIKTQGDISCQLQLEDQQH